MDHLQNELVSHLYRDDQLAEVMKETDDVAERREEIQEMHAMLQRALEIINEVRDFNTFK